MEHKHDKTVFAMKEISKVKAYLNHSLESIISENAILKKLRHPLISNLYFSFHDKENLYLVLDYLPGGNLRYYISEHTHFNDSQVKFFISCIILSIEYIHKNNIIHRDLKPENLLFDSEGYLHVTDFGISRVKKEGLEITDVSGTPGYISPEVIIGKPQNETSDYFSIGIITYELIFGKRPFEGNNKKEIADSILNTRINLNEHSIPKDFSPEVADFINRLLKRKNHQRLGARGIDEIKNHGWLEDVDWQGIEEKQMDITQMPFIPVLRDQDKNIIDSSEKKKIDKHNSILEKLNREGYFINFYFRFDDINKKKRNSYNFDGDQDIDNREKSFNKRL